MFVCSTTEFVKEQILRLRKLSPPHIQKKYRILMYLDCLVKFLATPAKTLSTKSYTPCAYSPEVGKYILDNFCISTQNGRCSHFFIIYCIFVNFLFLCRNRPNSMRDKTICYIMVLTALVTEYMVNLEDLCKEIKGKVKKLQDIARVLAFTPLSAKEKHIVVLKLPLPAQVSSSFQQRKKKK